MKKIKKMVEIEVEVLEASDIAAKLVVMQAGDDVVLNEKDFVEGELKIELKKALESIGVTDIEKNGDESLCKNPRHKSLTYNVKWNSKTECVITRI